MYSYLCQLQRPRESAPMLTDRKILTTLDLRHCPTAGRRQKPTGPAGAVGDESGPFSVADFIGLRCGLLAHAPTRRPFYEGAVRLRYRARIFLSFCIL